MPDNLDTETVRQILTRKLGKIKRAPLPSGSPSWEAIAEETWREIKRKARARRPGYSTFRKLLLDARFDR